MAPATLPLLIITGRPAAGKSEVIDFLKKTPAGERRERFHIGEFEELDDFLYVWETFETDDILTRHGRERLWTDERYWFTDEFVWDLYLERINLEYRKKLARNGAYHETMTTIVEFARGGPGAIAHALGCLHDEVLSRAAIVYIRVSYEESLRKNRRRARRGEEHSILYHSLPDEKMERYYRTNDWEDLEAADPSFVRVRDFRVPYAVFENEPEKTLDPASLGTELERVTRALWAARGKNG
ncbi:MAG TPA: hypothetical protein VL221_00910 [Bacteroidota bacterium]|nr:hypothetical protein [Bacteroidota bacterium]